MYFHYTTLPTGFTSRQIASHPSNPTCYTAGMSQRNKIAIGIFLFFYVGFGAFLTLKQESVIYLPFPQDFADCPAFATAEKVSHEGTRMYISDLDKPVVVLYHGNAGSACDRYFYADLFSQAGYGYVLVEYAGYSNDPRPTTHALVKQDVQNVITYLDAKNVTSVTVVGESIGTGVAAYHTALAPPDKLLLISPFTNLAEIARQRFWFYPTSLLVNNAFDNTKNLHDYRGHTTIIHGSQDNIIPYKLGKKLHESLSSEKQFVTISDAGHNDLFRFAATYSAISKFLTDTQ
jgi:pimeloyl-ACP methyl ester carboxylesterase